MPDPKPPEAGLSEEDRASAAWNLAEPDTNRAARFWSEKGLRLDDDLTAATKRIGELYTIINNDGSLVSHEEHRDILVDAIHAYDTNPGIIERLDEAERERKHLHRQLESSNRAVTRNGDLYIALRKRVERVAKRMRLLGEGSLEIEKVVWRQVFKECADELTEPKDGAESVKSPPEDGPVPQRPHWIARYGTVDHHVPETCAKFDGECRVYYGAPGRGDGSIEGQGDPAPLDNVELSNLGVAMRGQDPSTCAKRGYHTWTGKKEDNPRRCEDCGTKWVLSQEPSRVKVLSSELEAIAKEPGLQEITREYELGNPLLREPSPTCSKCRDAITKWVSGSWYHSDGDQSIANEDCSRSPTCYNCKQPTYTVASTDFIIPQGVYHKSILPISPANDACQRVVCLTCQGRKLVQERYTFKPIDGGYDEFKHYRPCLTCDGRGYDPKPPEQEPDFATPDEGEKIDARLRHRESGVRLFEDRAPPPRARHGGGAGAPICSNCGRLITTHWSGKGVSRHGDGSLAKIDCKFPDTRHPEPE